MLFLVGLGSLGGDSGFLAQFAAFSGAALQLGETTSIAAGQALNLTGVMAASATDVVSAVTSNGLNCSSKCMAWSGYPGFASTTLWLPDLRWMVPKSCMNGFRSQRLDRWCRV